MNESDVRETVAQFAYDYWERLRWQAGQMVPGMDGHMLEHGHILGPEHMLSRAMQPQDWLDMALYGAGLRELDPGYASDICQSLAEWLFVVPGSADYRIPEWWYDTPMGGLWVRAFIRSQGDELITIDAAAKLADVSQPAIANRIAAGDLRAYVDPDVRNPQQGRRLVRKSEVESVEWNRRARRTDAE